MEVEFVRAVNGTRMYLNLKICPLNEEGGEAEFLYTINNAKYEGMALVMEGGQRLLVTERDTFIITDALKNGESVRVIVGMYDELFQPGNLSLLY